MTAGCPMWRALDQQWIVNVAVVLATALSMPPAYATSNYSEQEKLIRAPRAVTTLGTDLFGDKVNLYSGNLEFTQLDVSLPGNSPLQVSVGRRLVAGRDPIQGGLFGQWDLEVPHLWCLLAVARLGQPRQYERALQSVRCAHHGDGQWRVLVRQRVLAWFFLVYSRAGRPRTPGT